MFPVSKLSIATGLTCVLAAVVAASPAFAGCKRMAFSVNDYGKDGPSKNSQDLLDKHIATWAAEQGIEKFTVGKKDTTCELFLNLIVVDEHTCTTRATVCWGGDKAPTTQQAKATKDTPSKPSEKSANAGKPAAKSPETPKDDSAAASKSTPTDTASEDAKPASDKTAEAKPEETKPAATTGVETGTLPLTNKTLDPIAPPKAQEASTSENVTVSDRDAVSAAAAAAERAADAAERAATAAERALAAMEKVSADVAKYQATAAAAPGASSAQVPPVVPAPTAKP